MTKSKLLKIAKPIIFNTEMVKAILSGNKTQTRRPIKGVNPKWDMVGGLCNDMVVTATDKNGDEYGKPVDGLFVTFKDDEGYVEFPVFNSKYEKGDILYVRETWCKLYDLDGNDQTIENTGKVYYAADNPTFQYSYFLRDDGTHKDYPAWKPSIHMPKEAARIFLRVTDVRVERLQDITEKDAISEGFSATGNIGELYEFIRGWNDIYSDKGYNWDTNSYVWVYEFEKD